MTADRQTQGKGALETELAAAVAAARQSRALDLSYGEFDDSLIEGLPELANLESADLSYTRITALSVIKLCQFRSLKRLSLSFTAVADAAAAAITSLSELEWLDLSGTDLTDAGLEQLVSLKKLQWLSVTGTGVTREGLQQFQRQHPQVTVHGAGAADVRPGAVASTPALPPTSSNQPTPLPVQIARAYWRFGGACLNLLGQVVKEITRPR